uniref:Uncharacterized protein n=1 Tax=Mycolicibacterium sp. CBMA 213 TaxID=1968788 RepID=A0A343VR19_9MYCO|nr:hypothetical protein B5P44_p00048 [Mycolicibacterium sp. CBMA 213]
MIDERHCLWCGRSLESAEHSGQLYCTAGHRTKQKEHKAKVADRVGLCPTPSKDSYINRGTAFRAAAIYGQYAYLCDCGRYHLTRNPGRTGRRTVGRRTVNQLARDIRGRSATRRIRSAHINTTRRDTRSGPAIDDPSGSHVA